MGSGRQPVRDEDGLPRVAARLLRSMLPSVERGEVLGDLAAEHAERRRRQGALGAWMWAWRQVLTSVPALARRGWWRGWSGFETDADRMQPRGAMFESLAMDVKYALRRLRKRPLYAALTVLTLSLGVAGTAAVYGIAKGLLLEPLPVAGEEEVAVFWFEYAWSEAEYAYLRPSLEGFESVAAYRRSDVTLRRGEGPAQLVAGVSATSELFEVLGVSPAIGPGFRAGDDVPGAEPVVVLSHGLWRDLGSSRSIVGERLDLSGEVRTVVGVMPEGFWYPDPTVRVWLSEEVDPANGTGNYGMVARMPPGATVASMGPQVERITELLGERFTYPEAWDKTLDPGLTPLREHLVGPVRPALVAMLAAMGVILLIACVNVAALMLGQVESRGTELAVRNALGAGRGRLLRQIAVESLVIGALAGVGGALLGVVGFRFLAGALPLGELAGSVALDWTVFWTAMGVALVAATGVALAPGASIARSDPQAGLRETRTAGVGGRRWRVEPALVVAQVALVLLLASGAALLIRSVGNLRAVETGVDVEGVAVLELLIPDAEAERIARTLTTVASAVEALPGVASVGVAQRLPLLGSSDNWGIGVESRPDLEETSTAFRVVSPGYLETMGVRLLRGRMLQETDRVPDPEEGVVVINEALAERYFPGTDPLGQRIAAINRWDRIVGVVANVAEAELTTEAVPARYMVHEQIPVLLGRQAVVARVAEGVDPAAILEAARRAVHAAAPAVAIRDATTMERIFERSMGPAVQVMALLTLLAALALTLGAIGVYGIVSHFVARRRRDWMIRIALGMRPARVTGHIVGRSGGLVVGGVALGLLAFAGLARLLAGFLYGVGAADPLALAAATTILLGAALLAAWLPARRAARVDPAHVLRES